MANVSEVPWDVQGGEVLRFVGKMFYITDTASNSFPDMASIPKPTYLQQAAPYFFAMTLLEWAVLAMKGKPARLNDGLFSVIHGVIMSLMEFLLGGIMFSTYLYIHANYTLFPLPWDSTWTFVAAGLGIDFCYYWVHRAAHEVNVLWAAHQVHHSSEEYNLSTALRQSAFQTFGSWPFYLPMAFFVPPQHAVVHKELNLLYQFWIHTELVQHLGPLEYVLNTASHHRVHHGANRYCLDKNYAGVLIIWDRMFGTFEAERDDVTLVYGLVDQPQFWNPIKHQVFYYGKVWEKAMAMEDWTGFFSAFVKGPGWFPGTKRLGDITFVEERPVREKYNPPHHTLLHLYTLAHFIISFVAMDVVVKEGSGINHATSLLVIVYILWTLTDIGLLYEGGAWAWPLELLRCVLSLALLGDLSSLASTLPTSPALLQATFTGSSMVAILCAAKTALPSKTAKME